MQRPLATLLSTFLFCIVSISARWLTTTERQSNAEFLHYANSLKEKVTSLEIQLGVSQQRLEKTLMEYNSLFLVYEDKISILEQKISKIPPFLIPLTPKMKKKHYHLGMQNLENDVQGFYPDIVFRDLKSDSNMKKSWKGILAHQNNSFLHFPPLTLPREYNGQIIILRIEDLNGKMQLRGYALDGENKNLPVNLEFRFKFGVKEINRTITDHIFTDYFTTLFTIHDTADAKNWTIPICVVKVLRKTEKIIKDGFIKTHVISEIENLKERINSNEDKWKENDEKLTALFNYTFRLEEQYVNTAVGNLRWLGLPPVLPNSEGNYPLVAWSTLGGELNWVQEWEKIKNKGNVYLPIPPVILPPHYGRWMLQIWLGWRIDRFLIVGWISDVAHNSQAPSTLQVRLEINIQAGSQRISHTQMVHTFHRNWTELVNISTHVDPQWEVPTAQVRVMPLELL